MLTITGTSNSGTSPDSAVAIPPTRGEVHVFWGVPGPVAVVGWLPLMSFSSWLDTITTIVVGGGLVVLWRIRVATFVSYFGCQHSIREVFKMASNFGMEKCILVKFMEEQSCARQGAESSDGIK